MKTLSVVLILIATIQIADAQKSVDTVTQKTVEKTSLWKITSPHRTVFLAGETMMLTSEDYPLPEAYTLAFSKSSELITEGEQNAKNLEETQQLIRKLGVLPSGKMLADILKNDQLTQLKQALDTFGISYQKIAHLKPWLAYFVLRNAAQSIYGFTSKKQLGAYFYKKAKERELPVSAFESTAYSLKMFASIPIEKQAKWLTKGAKEFMEWSDTRNDIIRAWRNGDNVKIEQLSKTQFEGIPNLYKLLSSDRNKRWVKKLYKLLNTDGYPVFVVVGLGHLFGPNNLLDLLTQEGNISITQL